MLLVLAIISLITIVVISAWKMSDNETKARVATHAKVEHKQVAVHHSDLEISAVGGSSYVAVHKGGPAGKILFEGTVNRGKTDRSRASGSGSTSARPRTCRSPSAARPSRCRAIGRSR